MMWCVWVRQPIILLNSLPTIQPDLKLPTAAMSASINPPPSPSLRSRAPPRQAIYSLSVLCKLVPAEPPPQFRITGLVHPPPLIQTTYPPTMTCLCQATLRVGAPFLSPERLPCPILSGFPREDTPAMWG